MSEAEYNKAAEKFFSQDKPAEVIADVEPYNSFVLMLTMKWADTYNYSDKDLYEFMSGAMFSILDKAENTSEDIKKSSAAGEEIEFLLDLLKSNCRHNTYKLT